MKKFLFTLLAAFVFAGGLVATAAEKKEPSPEQKKKMLEKYDKNKDGKLDAEEEAAAKADRAKGKGKKKGQ